MKFNEIFIILINIICAIFCLTKQFLFNLTFYGKIIRAIR